MSSDQNTPDFDSMSPEEVMAWMESLAKRQGADASTFTTAADMEVDEIDPDSVDMESLGEYIPHGWTKEKWEAHLAKEEAEKAAKQQAKSQPVAEPDDDEDEELAPAVASQSVASSSGEMDVDNMSPEQLMAWMESLAKRQGADAAGFMTDANMDIAEIDPDSVDESIRNQKYVPHGWTEEKWEAHLAKEAEQKAAKQQAIPDFEEPEYTDDSEQYEIIDEDDLELLYDEDEDEELAVLDFDDLPAIDVDEDEYDEDETVAIGDSPLSWLEDLASDDSGDDDEDEFELPDLSGIGDDMSGLEAIANQDAGDPMDWLAGLAGDVDPGGETGIDLNLDLGDSLSGLEALVGEPEEDEQEEISIGSDVDPVAWLETLADREGAPEEELVTDANIEIPDFGSLSADEQDEAEEDEQLFLEDILDETQPSEEIDAIPVFDASDPSQIDNPEAWLDAIASNSALIDDGQMSMFDDYEGEDDEEDEDYDDEDEDEAVGVVDESHDTRVIDALNRGEDLSPADIEQFFANQFKKAEQFADLDEGFDDDIDSADEAIQADIPDWLQEMGAGPAIGAQSAIGDDDDESFGEDLMADVLEGLEAEEEEDLMASALEGLVIEEDAMPSALEELELDLVDDDDEAIPGEIPDWLLEGAEQDTGDVVADIIAGEDIDIPVGETTVLETEVGQIEVDPNDTWTQAFLMEDREEDAEEWYQNRLTEITGQMPPITDAELGLAPELDEDEEEEAVAEVVSAPVSGATLAAADLPVEEDLAEGEPEEVPAWLTGAVAATPVEVPSVIAQVADTSEDDIDIPDWLSDSMDEDDDIAIPDWLTEDEPSLSEAIPDWLNEAGIEDIEPAEIPSWLMETVDEPVDVVETKPEPVKAAPPAKAPTVVQQPATIVPVQVAADVSGALKEAKTLVGSGDLDGAMIQYESVVRANQQLDVVVTDLRKLTSDEKTRKNPTVYRVLGDALMRAGDLQEALDTYRRALNLL